MRKLIRYTSVTGKQILNTENRYGMHIDAASKERYSYSKSVKTDPLRMLKSNIEIEK